jgi:hypothetical protein
MEDQVALTMSVRHHSPIQRIETDAAENAVKHGEGITHSPPLRILTMQ